MNLSSSTVPASLSLAMRDGSRAEHDAAEQSPFISELLAGRVNTDGYVDYLMRLQMIYTAIEDAGGGPPRGTPAGGREYPRVE
ncbi:biliverdin-producing heme oxygenase, partial [Mycobacteroides abscessus subsp. bolletii]|uniref:biliverdin-producing heme oxygenase n=1 Tax=Mycobacteroides abscessus TaxID=36809 RepID=UPI00266B71F6